MRIWPSRLVLTVNKQLTLSPRGWKQLYSFVGTVHKLRGTGTTYRINIENKITTQIPADIKAIHEQLVDFICDRFTRLDFLVCNR